MRRYILAFAFVTAASGAAFADDTRVRSSATVEVLDDKAQIDDVISRMRGQEKAAHDARTAAADAAKAAAGTLKQDRPPAPTSAADSSHRPVGPDSKEQRPGSRRTNRERNGNPDHTERTRHHRR
jgi:hypothetical protein